MRSNNYGLILHEELGDKEQPVQVNVSVESQEGVIGSAVSVQVPVNSSTTATASAALDEGQDPTVDFTLTQTDPDGSVRENTLSLQPGEQPTCAYEFTKTSNEETLGFGIGVFGGQFGLSMSQSNQNNDKSIMVTPEGIDVSQGFQHKVNANQTVTGNATIGLNHSISISLEQKFPRDQVEIISGITICKGPNPIALSGTFKKCFSDKKFITNTTRATFNQSGSDVIDSKLTFSKTTGSTTQEILAGIKSDRLGISSMFLYNLKQAASAGPSYSFLFDAQKVEVTCINKTKAGRCFQLIGGAQRQTGGVYARAECSENKSNGLIFSTFLAGKNLGQSSQNHGREINLGISLEQKMGNGIGLKAKFEVGVNRDGVEPRVGFSLTLPDFESQSSNSREVYLETPVAPLVSSVSQVVRTKPEAVGVGLMFLGFANHMREGHKQAREREEARRREEAARQREAEAARQREAEVARQRESEETRFYAFGG